MSRLGRKPLCLHNDAIFLPHIKDKSLWASKRLECDFPHFCWKNQDEFPLLGLRVKQNYLFMATGGVKILKIFCLGLKYDF